jgi:prepilin-type N-terminal cleavage/methylation domain-containing protein
MNNFRRIIYKEKLVRYVDHSNTRGFTPTLILALLLFNKFVLSILQNIGSFFALYELSLISANSRHYKCRGFTLIETMVALSILVVSIAAPMSLAVKSLSSAFYARDQVTAFHLAQEAIEAIRAERDGNALRAVQGTSVDLLAGIPSTAGSPFTVDTRNNSMSLCSSGTCEPLKNDGDFYGHGAGSNWVLTRFTRTVTANKVGGSDDEIKISVEVRWKSGTFQERAFTISENLYRWVNDGT